jgi:hypothetical protein
MPTLVVGMELPMMSENPYQSPPEDALPAESPRPEKTGDAFMSALKVGVVTQLVLFILTALIMDGGRTNRMCVMAIIGYWIAAAAILIRRRHTPTRVDLLFLKYGIWGLMIVTPMIARLVYRMIGESSLSGLDRWF